MKHVSILIIALLCVNFVSNCRAYVLESSTESGNKIESNEKSQAVEIEPEHVHISRIVHPSEIRVPTLSELATFINLDENDTDDANEAKPNNSGERQAQEVQSLTYTELYKLLAMWQLSNERNFYSMHTTREAADSVDIIDIPENFVTAAN